MTREGPSPLLRLVASRRSLDAAWRRVESRRAGPGGDGLTVEVFARDAPDRLDRLSARLVDRSYRPPPARRIRLRDDPGRLIGLPSVVDRVVQTALARALGPVLGPRLSACVFSYRTGVSVEHALLAIDGHLASGRVFWARSDIERFFDALDWPALCRSLAALGVPGDVVALVRRIVHASVLEGAALHEPTRGVAQGGALSPLLSNVFLAGLDADMERRRFAYLRYADDLLVLADTEAEAADGLACLASGVEALGLRLSGRKTARGHVAEGFCFLGVRFDAAGRSFTRAALAALTRRLDELHAARAGPADFVDVVRAWRAWHGVPRAADADRLVVLAALALEAGERADAAEIGELAARRLALPATEHLDSDLHAALAVTWWQAGRASACARAALIDARLAACLGASGACLATIGRVFGLPRAEVAVLGEPLPAAIPRLEAAGAAELAQAARLLAGPARRPPDGSGVAALPDGEDLVTLLRERWGRGVVRASIERRDSRGHRRFVPDTGRLTDELLRHHVLGGARVAIHLTSPEATVTTALFDIRPRREALAAGALASGTREPFARAEALVHDDALALARASRRLGLSALLEDTGGHGRRVWLAFDAPVALRHARALLVEIEDEAPSCRPDLVRERMPARDAPRRDLGPVAVLPFGRHPGTGKWSRLLDEHGHGVDAPSTLLAASAPLAADAVTRRARVGSLGGPRPGEPALDLARDWASLPLARAVLGGCRVLAALATKALRLGYLDGVELGTLVETLGHLAGEAEPALGRLVGPTGVASAGHLRRRLQRLASHPISCAKVRARHAALAVDADCECRFGGLPPGCYATPVLHALRAADVGAWKGLMRRRRRQAPKRKCQPCSPPTATADAGSREASPLRAIEDALRGVVAARRARPDTLDAALRRLLSAVDALPSGAVELSVGRLVVLRRDPPTFVITP